MVNLPIAYSDKPVTPFGGMSLLKRMLDKTQIYDHLTKLDLPVSGSNRGYVAADIVLSFWLGIWTGASRYIHCDWVRYDSVLQDIFGLQQMPSQSTYSRFFNKFNQARNTEVFPALQNWFMQQLEIGALTVDFDSTVITRYGEQEGSAVGYNPNKKGRNSHHPLIAFISQTRMIANAWLRPGNTAASSNCVAFMRETFDSCLQGKNVGLVRGDSGFYTEEILDYLEQERKNYVVAVRMYPNIKSEVLAKKEWIILSKGIELSEMTFSHVNGKPRRYIIVKKRVEERPNCSGKMTFGQQKLPLGSSW